MTEGKWDPKAALAAEIELQDEKSEATTWKPDEGDELVGTLIDAAKVHGKYGIQKVLTIRDDDDQVWTVWCGPKVLDNLLSDKKPKVGAGIMFKYGGKQESKSGGNAYHSYYMTCQDSDPEFWAGLKAADREERAPVVDDGLSDPF